jgi:NTE family protein
MSDRKVTPRIGLALGGGAARGWAHIGVLKTLANAGIVPDIVVGTSIGAVVGGCHLAGQLDALESFAMSLNRRRILGYLDFNLAGTGLINGDRLTKLLDKHLGPLAIETLPKPFAAITTELNSGNEIWLTKGNLVEAMRASYALPGIFPPVKLDGRWLFDGALVNPIPVNVCRALGAQYVIAVNLNSDLCTRGTTLPDPSHSRGHPAPEPAPIETADGKPADSAVSSLLWRQWFGGGGADKAPGISSVVADALRIVQDRIARSRLAGDPPDALINPRLVGIGPFEFHRADELIAHGMAAARRETDDIIQQIALRARLFRQRASA